MITDNVTAEDAETLELLRLREEVERLRALRASVFCSKCGRSLEFLGGDGLIGRSGQCEACKARGEVERLKGCLDLVNSCFQDEISDFNDYRDEAKHQATTLTAERDAERAEVERLKKGIEGIGATLDAVVGEANRQRVGWTADLATLVAERDAAVAMAKAEREACANVANLLLNDADRHIHDPVRLGGYRDACADLETAIRARKS